MSGKCAAGTPLLRSGPCPRCGATDSEPCPVATQRDYDELSRLRTENTLLRAQVEGAAKLREAADRVCWFDWSDNDRDAAAAIEELRGALRQCSIPSTNRGESNNG